MSKHEKCFSGLTATKKYFERAQIVQNDPKNTIKSKKRQQKYYKMKVIKYDFPISEQQKSSPTRKKKRAQNYPKIPYIKREKTKNHTK